MERRARNGAKTVSIRRTAWLGLGFASLGLGLAGAVLPLLPTTPFLLLAAWAFSNSSERLHRWLLEHPRLGPVILDWRRHRRIPLSAKVLATVLLGASLGTTVAFSVLPGAFLVGFALFLAGVLAWIWTRPSARVEPE